MKHEFLCQEGNSRLLIFFAGWGMDANVLSDIRRTGYDTLAVWDYTSLHIDWSIAMPYSEICVFAWSMGVYAASLTCQALAPRITLAVAINGTMHPIHDKLGIPEATFYGTLDGLSERSVAKFFRRMSAEKADHDHFTRHMPSRSIDDLREELVSIADTRLLHAPAKPMWDVAVVGRHDRIFPFHNQMAAWEKDGGRIKVVDRGHYFDFATMVENFLIDKPLVRSRFEAGTPTYSANAGVQAETVDRMMALAKAHSIDACLRQSPNRILEVGSGAGLLSIQLARHIREATLEMWDLAAPFPASLPPNRKYKFVNCDAEMHIRRLPPCSVDAFFSASTIQWFNSPTRFLKEVERVLSPGGYAVISTFAEGNLHQISDVTGRSLPLLKADEWAKATAGLRLLECETYERDLDFASPLEVLRHLKLTGVNALGSAENGPELARRIISDYPMMLDARYHLTYKPIILILQKNER